MYALVYTNIHIHAKSHIYTHLMYINIYIYLRLDVETIEVLVQKHEKEIVIQLHQPGGHVRMCLSVYMGDTKTQEGQG